MKRMEKAERIGKMLDELYPETPVPLDHSDPYTLLVAVMLSAQTTDKKVNEVTPALFSAASTPEEMAKLEITDIQAVAVLCKEFNIKLAVDNTFMSRS